MELKPNNLIKAVQETVFIIMVACVLAVCSNFLRNNGIPFMQDWSAKNRLPDESGQNRIISLEGAIRMYEQRDAVFVDARSEHQFNKGHIKDALSLPWHQVDERFMEIADRLENRKAVITYCDGESCSLSHDLSQFLEEMGFENVYVLVNGWTLWRKAGLPTQKEERSNEYE